MSRTRMEERIDELEEKLEAKEEARALYRDAARRFVEQIPIGWGWWAIHRAKQDGDLEVAETMGSLMRMVGHSPPTPPEAFDGGDND